MLVGKGCCSEGYAGFEVVDGKVTVGTWRLLDVGVGLISKEGGRVWAVGGAGSDVSDSDRVAVRVEVAGNR